MIIYSHLNIITNKRYIGYTTKTLEERFLVHCKKARNGSKLHFHNAIRMYSKDAWISEILEYVDNQLNLCEKEIYWISYYNSYHAGYNSTPGGDGRGFVKGRKQTKEHTEKIINAHKEKWKKEIHPLKGIPISDTKKEQIRKTLTGIKHTEKRRKNQSLSAKNRLKTQCYNCNKMIDICNINRWHNKNCKFRQEILSCEPLP